VLLDCITDFAGLGRLDNHFAHIKKGPRNNCRATLSVRFDVDQKR